MAKKQTVSQQVTSSNTISVLSKLPFDLSFINAKGEKKIIKGMKASSLVITKGAMGLYATTNLDRDDWEYFAKINKNAKILVNKIILANEDIKEARAEAKEHQKEKTGLEQIDPKEVPNIQKSTSEEANSNPIVISE